MTRKELKWTVRDYFSTFEQSMFPGPLHTDRMASQWGCRVDSCRRSWSRLWQSRWVWCTSCWSPCSPRLPNLQLQATKHTVKHLLSLSHFAQTVHIWSFGGGNVLLAVQGEMGEMFMHATIFQHSSHTPVHSMYECKSNVRTVQSNLAVHELYLYFVYVAHFPEMTMMIRIITGGQSGRSRRRQPLWYAKTTTMEVVSAQQWISNSSIKRENKIFSPYCFNTIHIHIVKTTTITLQRRPEWTIERPNVGHTHIYREQSRLTSHPNLKWVLKLMTGNSQEKGSQWSTSDKHTHTVWLIA